jgi:hypothetical protein
MKEGRNKGRKYKGKELRKTEVKKEVEEIKDKRKGR